MRKRIRYRGARFRAALTITQTTCLTIMGERLGADSPQEAIRRVIEALWAAHERGQVNLDNIRYGVVIPDNKRKSVEEWLDQ